MSPENAGLKMSGRKENFIGLKINSCAGLDAIHSAEL
jgi:hypothetical protein